MENKIIVRNSRVISEYFDIPLEIGEDITQRNEKSIKDFLKKYEDDLFISNYDKFKEFTKKTGIVITRVYQKINDYKALYMNELGVQEENVILKNHLTVYIYVDDIIKEDGCLYEVTNEIKNLIYQQNDEYDKSLSYGHEVRHIINDKELKLNEKVKKINKIVPNAFLSKINISKIRKIKCIYPYEDILVLTENGDLFVNNNLYAQNVRDLCNLTSYRTYIIFENENIEFYTNTSIDGSRISSKKTLNYEDFFIAFLDNIGQLFVTTIGNSYIGSNFDYDNCIEFSLFGIDNFNYVHDYDTGETSLILSSNNEDILFPLEIMVWK